MHGRDHVLLNRDLFREFAARLAAAEWDVALLQEVPPRWAGRLGAATGAEVRVALTSRNWMRPFTFPAARLRPHLVGSWEGGSNLILVRRTRARGSGRSRASGRRTSEAGDRPGTAIAEYRRATLTWRPERRVVSMVRLDGGLCLANLHASTGRRAERDVIRAAGAVVEWAGESPLLLGGDFNVRPARTRLFVTLAEEFGLTGATDDDGIDHLLARHATVIEPAATWPPGRRDVPDPESGLLIRLSDHSPVEATVTA